MNAVAGLIGRKTHELLGQLGGMALLSFETFTWIFVAPFSKGKSVKKDYVIFQMARVGYSSLSIVILVLFFMGMILALQMDYILQKFGVTEYVGSVVGVGLLRELGPLITAMVMSGFVGASITAEIGTMAVSEEIEALKVSAINPIRFLVAPRVLGSTLMVPLVTLVGDIIGIIGGLIIAVFVMDLSPHLYFQKVIEPLVYKDLFSGLLKSVVFGFLIGIIACYEGLKVGEGASGVGKSTTRAVVLAITFIIVTDCFITALLYFT